MMKRLTLVAILMMLALTGCKDESPPTTTEAKQPTTPKVKDAAPEAAVNQYVTLLNNKQYSRVVETVIPEQQPYTRVIFGSQQAMEEAVAQMHEKAEKAFPGHGVDLTRLEKKTATGTRSTVVPSSTTTKPLKVVSVEKISETDATAMLRSNGTAESAINIKRVGNEWRVVQPGVPTESNQQTDLMLKQIKWMADKIIEAHNNVSNRLDANEFTSIEQVKAALTDAVFKIAQ